MTARAARAAAFFRSAALLAAVLAVVAGFTGMHVLAGAHAAHAAATVQAPASAQSPAGHGETESRRAHESRHAHTPSLHDHAASLPARADHRAEHAVGAVGAVSDTCFGDCCAAAGMGTDCVPSPKHADWKAPPPGTAAAAVDHHGALPDVRARSYPYLPGSPSPGELSISRT